MSKTERTLRQSGLSHGHLRLRASSRVTRMAVKAELLRSDNVAGTLWTSGPADLLREAMGQVRTPIVTRGGAWPSDSGTWSRRGGKARPAEIAGASAVHIRAVKPLIVAIQRRDEPLLARIARDGVWEGGAGIGKNHGSKKKTATGRRPHSRVR